MEEVWKPVEGYEGLYEVSNLGKVRSLDRMVRSPRTASGFRKVKGMVLAPINMPLGYHSVALSKNGKQRHTRVHRIVAQAFVPGRTEEKNIINHKDRNPANNRADNLEWCTQAYNMSYDGARERGLATRMARGLYPKQPKSVVAVKDGKVVKRFPSLAEAARNVGKTRTSICACCKGKKNTCAGYQWRYADEEQQ